MPEQDWSLDDLVQHVSCVTYILRTRFEYDRSLGLELLIEKFLMLKYFPFKQNSSSSNFQHRIKKLNSHIRVLRLLLLLADVDKGIEKISDRTYALISNLKAQRGENSYLNAPKVFEGSCDKSEYLAFVPGNLDLFRLKEGPLETEGNSAVHTDSRLCRKGVEYVQFSEESFEPKEFQGSLQSFSIQSINQKFWIEDTRDLLGALMHKQSENQPFGICLEIPPLEKTEPSIKGLPFPTMSYREESSLQISTPSTSASLTIKWDECLDKVLSSTYSQEIQSLQKLSLWEEKEPRYRIQSVMRFDEGCIESYIYRQSLSEMFYDPLVVKEQVLIKHLKLILQGVPTRYFILDLNSKSIKQVQSLRLVNETSEALQGILDSFITSGTQLYRITSFCKDINKSEDRVQRTYGVILTEFLSFYQSSIINIPDSISILKFYHISSTLRHQLDITYSLSLLNTDLPFYSGASLIDYLYKVCQENEGDEEIGKLLKIFFQAVVKDFLMNISKLIFIGEVHDHQLLIQQSGIEIKNPLDRFYGAFMKHGGTELLGKHIDDVVKCANNLYVLRTLSLENVCYYNLCSKGSHIQELKHPVLKLKFSSNEIKRKLEKFIAFQGEQTTGLLEIERELMRQEEATRDMKLEEIRKVVSGYKDQAKAYEQALRQQEVEKIAKSKEFHKILDKQLQENTEYKRIKLENELKKQQEQEEKEKKRQDELIELGKQELIERYSKLMQQVEDRQMRSNWVSKRRELNDKRLELFAEDEDRWKKLQEEKEAQMEIEIGNEEVNTDDIQIELPTAQFPTDNSFTFRPADIHKIEGKIVQSIEENIVTLNPHKFKDVDSNVKILEENIHPIERIVPDMSKYFAKRVIQPPGGSSSMTEIFNFKWQEAQKAPQVEQARIGYRPDLERIEICSSLFYEEIIRRVFQKITPRKRWNLPTSTKPKSIFEGLINEDDLLGSGSREYPLKLIVQKTIVDPILSQLNFINQSTMHLFLRKLKLIEHLTAFKRYSLMGAGDAIELFLTSVFDGEAVGSVNSIFETAIKLSSSKDDPYAERIKIVDTKELCLGISANLRSLEDLNFFQVQYTCEWPLDIIFHPRAVKQYSNIFIILLKLRYVSKILNSIHRLFHNQLQRGFGATFGKKVRRILLLRQKMQHILDIIQGHISSEVHGTSWNQLLKDLDTCKSMEDILKSHHDYLKSIHQKCFIEEESFINQNMQIIYGLVIKLSQTLLYYTPYQVLHGEADKEIDSISDDFNRIHRFLFNMLRTAASKGKHQSLFTRLDFNAYMENKIESEAVKW